MCVRVLLSKRHVEKDVGCWAFAHLLSARPAAQQQGKQREKSKRKDNAWHGTACNPVISHICCGTNNHMCDLLRDCCTQ